MQSAYGQFVSILYASMVILFEVNGPRADRTFGECRASYASCSGGGSPRTLAIMNRLGQEHRDGVARAKQRGDLIGRLRAMRDLASPAKRADLNVCEADIEPVNGVNDGTVQTLYSTMPLWFCFASWQRGGIADEENGSHLVASIMELHITTRSAVLSRWPDNQNSHARICNCCRGGGGAVCSGSVGHMTETWSNVPDIVKAQNMLGFLASCRWPSRLDHWRPLPVQLVADVNDLFLYAAGAELQQQSCSSRAAAGSYAGMLRRKDYTRA